jgi:hypothetical protein
LALVHPVETMEAPLEGGPGSRAQGEALAAFRGDVHLAILNEERPIFQ